MMSGVQFSKRILLIVLLLLCFNSYAQQQTNTDQTYISAIKAVEFYNSTKENAFPIINLNSADKLLLGFDDLRGGTQYLNYTIIHCDGDWNPSNLSPAEYLQNYTEDKITDYKYSTNTIQKYTHYELTLPNEYITPKLSGNYLLKVYLNGDMNKLVLTRRFYVVDAKISMSSSALPSNNNNLRQSNQKINFQLNYTGLQVQDNNRDLRTLILQNMRYDKSKWSNMPNSIRGNQLIYNDLFTNDFAGGNEFRHFDTRSLRLNSDRIERIFRDTVNSVILLGDPNRDQAAYSFQYDNNGNFYILNQDGNNPKIDADYAHMYFTLAANKTDKEGSAYIVGRFNNYQLNEQSKMQFDGGRARFYTDIFLKQGVYDYEYIWVDKQTKVADDTPVEGSYFDTENDYQFLVYYHRPGSRYEELVGYSVLNTSSTTIKRRF